MNYLRLVVFLLFVPGSVFAQSGKKVVYKWWDPESETVDIIDGQAWPDKVGHRYDRLPASAKEKVRKPLWDLSKNPAGLIIRFISNSPVIIVKYKVTGPLSFPHMPATGVSGVDLYYKNDSGTWQWCKPGRSYGDTISYRFSSLYDKNAEFKDGREYKLYLPLYNTVEFLEIGVVDNSVFKALPARKEKPVVVYGTSIAQGACASRPGMAWTAIVERELDIPLVNLGFSGNGRLEKEMIELLTQIDARVYVLDCLPNLLLGRYDSTDVYNRIIVSVKELKAKRPGVPVLLVDHASYHPKLNEISHKAFTDLKAEGIDKLYLLTNKELGLYFDSFVDGTHPSDYGMEGYARAYKKKLCEILIK